ncbi:MAG: hypothetical protein HYS98_04875, partial [Deltaproteobacteria bacterium]|nr:hypothetical protein [Deltaproteobacteria bacterium]
YLPPIQAVKLRSKNFLPEWCTLEKIETPKTEVLSSKNAIEKIQGLIGFPCFIKGSIAGAALAHDAYEAKVLFDKISYLWGFPVIAQKKIFGSDFVLACVANDQHKILGSICVKKAATNSLGKCQMGIIVENDTVYKMAAHIVEKLQWRGALEIEVVYDPFRKKYFLIEINSRFPAWISISSQLSYPLVEQYVDLALGKEVAALKPCPSGYFFSRNTKETFFDAQDFATLATHGQLLEDDIYYEES